MTQVLTSPITAKRATFGGPITQTTSPYSFLGIEHDFIVNNAAGSTILGLPGPAFYVGREIYIKTTQAQFVWSSSANVVPLAGGAASTAILTNTAGKWARIVSDATNWIIMASN